MYQFTSLRIFSIILFGDNMKNELMVKLIKSYQKNKQIIGVGHCKFYPTCSEYALRTYEKFNFFYATLLVGIRILRCNPLSRRRPYPVKLTKKEKDDIKFINNLKKDFDNDFIEYTLGINEIKDLTEGEFYNYLYDYYYLPKHPTTNVKDDLVFASRYIVSSKKLDFDFNDKLDKTFCEYLDYVKKLYEKGLIKMLPKKEIPNLSNLFLIPVDALTLEDILKDQLDKSIIVINNYDKDIYIEGYDVITYQKGDFKKFVKGLHNVIIKTTNFDIFKHLPLIDYSINFYNRNEEINYFYNLNKKKPN